MRRGDWRRQTLPAHDGGGWAVWLRGRRTACSNATDAVTRIGSWLPGNPVLVAAPTMTHFVPPVAIDTFRQRFRDDVVRYWRLLTIAALLAAIACLAARALAISLSLLLLACVFALECLQFSRSRDAVLERALFFYWLRTSLRGSHALVLWATVSGFAGCLQLAALAWLGSLEAVFDAYGLMYPAARAGEWWRLLTGPFVHYNVLHFTTNAALLVLGGWIASALRPLATGIAFAAGCVLSAWCQMTLGGQVFDNFGGMSGGVFAVFALLVVSGFLDRGSLPAGLAVYLGGLLLFSGVTAELLSESTATVAHLTGAATGAVVAVISHRAQSRGPRSRAFRAGARS